jgi:hypothetical protein
MIEPTEIKVGRIYRVSCGHGTFWMEVGHVTDQFVHGYARKTRSADERPTPMRVRKCNASFQLTVQ